MRLPARLVLCLSVVSDNHIQTRASCAAYGTCRTLEVNIIQIWPSRGKGEDINSYYERIKWISAHTLATHPYPFHYKEAQGPFRGLPTVQTFCDVFSWFKCLNHRLKITLKFENLSLMFHSPCRQYGRLWSEHRAPRSSHSFIYRPRTTGLCTLVYSYFTHICMGPLGSLFPLCFLFCIQLLDRQYVGTRRSKERKCNTSFHALYCSIGISGLLQTSMPALTTCRRRS